MNQTYAMDQHALLVRQHEAAVLGAIASMKRSMFEATTRLENVAAAGFYSPFHFHRTFRRVTETTPARFLASLRMQQAKQLLATSDQTIATISGLVGYESLGTFTTQFGRLVGTSPGRFRQLVDTCGSNVRLNDVAPHDSTPGGRKLVCSTADNVALTGRTTIVGLFEGGLPSGLPASFAMVPELAEGNIIVPTRSGSDMFALAVSVPNEIRLVDLAIGAAESVLIGRTPVALDQNGGTAPLCLELRRPRQIDPPLLSAAAVLHLVRAIR